MIIKNMSGKVLFLGKGSGQDKTDEFVKLFPQGLPLQIDEEKDVPEVLADSAFFQELENSGDIAILAFDPDFTRTTVRDEIDPTLTDHEDRITILELGGGGGGTITEARYDFVYWKLPSTFGPSDMHFVFEPITEAIIQSDGFLVKATIQSTLSRTSGTITAKPKKNGTLIADTGLHLLIDGTNPQDQFKEIAPGNSSYEFSKGDKLKVEIESSGFSPASPDILVTFFLLT